MKTSDHTNLKFFINRTMAFLGVLIVMIAYTNCSRPYQLEVQNYEESVSELAAVLQLQPDQKIEEVSYFTQSRIRLQLSKKHAQEMIVSFTSSCKGEWEPYQENFELPWKGDDGMAEIFVKFRNFSKDESDCFRAEFVMDTKAPEIKVVTRPGIITPIRNVEFVFVLNDNGSGVQSFECRIDEEAWRECDKEFIFQNMTDGDYVLEYRARDKVGHQSSIRNIDWKIDENAPFLIFEEEPNFYSNTNYATFKFSTTVNSETGLKGDRFTCSLDGVSFIDCQSPYHIEGLSDGEHSLQIRVFDTADNFAVFVKDWTVDTKIPSLILSTLPEPITNSTIALFNFRGADGNGSGIAGFICSLNGSSFKPCQSGGREFIDLTDGEQRMAIKAVDRAGNESLESVHNWSVDTTGPVAEIVKMPPDRTSNRDIQFEFNISPTPPAAINSVQCRWKASDAFGPCTSGSNFSSRLNEGDYQFEMRAIDVAGNITSKKKSFTIDLSGPSIEIIDRPNRNNNLQNPVVKLNATDGSGVAQTQCQLNDGEKELCDFALVSVEVTNSGQHTLRTWATDNLGNTSSRSLSWNTDFIGAVIQWTQAPPSVVTEDTYIVLHYSISDNNSGGRHFCYINDSRVLGFCENTEFKLRYKTKGTYNIEIRAQDSHNNFTSLFHTLVVK